MNAVTFNRGFAEGASRGGLFLSFLVCAALAAVGCGDDGGGMTPIAGTGAGVGVGAAGVGAAGLGAAGMGAAGMGAAGTGAAAPTLTQVFPIFQTSCGVCHAMPAKPATNGGFGGALTKAQFLAAVLNKPATGTCVGMGSYVVPGNPAQSILYQKLLPNPACGVRMPQGSELTASEIALFMGWIAAGAKDD